MEAGGAYGGGKAGGAFDPILFVQRPQVILRAVCLLFAIIIFWCISSNAWYTKGNREECIINKNPLACEYPVAISALGFLACMAFLAGEYFFEQMSSVKSRKHFVGFDLGFSGIWSLAYFFAFCHLCNQWGKTETDYPTGASSVKTAIAFSFFSIFTWAGCTFLAFQRFRQGVGTAFATNYEADVTMPSTYNTSTNQSYPGGLDSDQMNYQDPPFGATNQRGLTDFQNPAY